MRTKTIATAAAIVVLWRRGRLSGLKSRFKKFESKLGIGGARSGFVGLGQDGVYALAPSGRPAAPGSGFALDTWV